jgi:hypothetical protein
MPKPTNYYELTDTITDVSTASSVRFAVPHNGFLREVRTVLGGAISGADAVITVGHNGTALTPTITVANASSAEGDIDSVGFYRGVSKGDWIEVATGGESTDTAQLGVTVVLSA